MTTRCARSIPLILLSAVFAAPAHAQSSSFSGAVALSSQLVDRGLALSPVTPILQGNASWSTASGWSLSVSAATETRSPGHGSEAMAQLARYWSLSNDWRMDAGVVYYAYPGNAAARPYERVEASVNWMYRDVLSFGLSGITLTHGEDHQPKGAADVDFHWPLPQNFAFSAGLGVAQPLTSSMGVWTPSDNGSAQHYGYSYRQHYGYVYNHAPSYYGYGHLGVSWAHGPWRVELDRVFTDPDIRRQGSAAAPWVATIAWNF